jgi:hypothetical protein
MNNTDIKAFIALVLLITCVFSLVVGFNIGLFIANVVVALLYSNYVIIPDMNPIIVWHDKPTLRNKKTEKMTNVAYLLIALVIIINLTVIGINYF